MTKTVLARRLNVPVWLLLLRWSTAGWTSQRLRIQRGMARWHRGGAPCPPQRIRQCQVGVLRHLDMRPHVFLTRPELLCVLVERAHDLPQTTLYPLEFPLNICSSSSALGCIGPSRLSHDCRRNVFRNAQSDCSGISSCNHMCCYVQAIMMYIMM